MHRNQAICKRYTEFRKRDYQTTAELLRRLFTKQKRTISNVRKELRLKSKTHPNDFKKEIPNRTGKYFYFF